MTIYRRMSYTSAVKQQQQKKKTKPKSGYTSNFLKIVAKTQNRHRRSTLDGAVFLTCMLYVCYKYVVF